MAWTASDLDAIKAAIGSGVLRVDYSDRTIVYRSMAELLQAKQLIEAEVNPPPGGGPVVRRSFASFRRD
jgi:hypothetical protein